MKRLFSILLSFLVLVLNSFNDMQAGKTDSNREKRRSLDQPSARRDSLVAPVTGDDGSISVYTSRSSIFESQSSFDESSSSYFGSVDVLYGGITTTQTQNLLCTFEKEESAQSSVEQPQPKVAKLKRAGSNGLRKKLSALRLSFKLLPATR